MRAAYGSIDGEEVEVAPAPRRNVRARLTADQVLRLRDALHAFLLADLGMSVADTLRVSAAMGVDRHQLWRRQEAVRPVVARYGGGLRTFFTALRDTDYAP